MGDNTKNIKTWNDYKVYAKDTDLEIRIEIEEAEQLASIVSAIIERRNIMGISQRELANMSGLPQSSIARIETYRTIPNLSTLFKIMKPLGLTLKVLPTAE